MLLAISPVIWLVNTWLDPAFASHGVVYFAIVAAAAAWSLTSRRLGPNDPGFDRIAIVLLAATALVRLAGQVLAVDTIGALALIVDVYALGRLAGLDRRVRALSPFWLAIAFAFALPLERIVQRSIGFLLQDVSARGACGVLSAVFGDVQCAGVRITVENADVLVDLPCSGAQALILFGFGFALAAMFARPRPFIAMLGGMLALAAAVAGNVLRITLLASGVAIGSERVGFDVMAQPWHDVVGMIALAAAAPVVLVWACRVAPQRIRDIDAPATRRRRHGRVASGLFLIVAVAVVSAPRRPLDVVPGDVSIEAPARIGAFRAAALTLTDRERGYFEQYGGAAVKAAYGPHALMLARTTSPLRHLHAPDECLRGLGYRVTYLGMRFTPVPTAHYRAVAPDGRAYRVDVSFLSNRGHATASVSEAVWIWLADRSTIWTAVQRISVDDVAPSEQVAFDAGVFAALDQTGSHPTQLAAGGEHAR